MNKRDAKKAADSFTGTVGDIRAILEKADKNGMSAINPSFPKAQIWGMFWAAWSGRDDKERPNMFAHADGSGGGTRDRMNVQNVFREFT